MIETVLESDRYGFTWVDVTSPTQAELNQVGARYGLHKTSIEDCLQPSHLPKFEQFGSASFMIARSFDLAAQAEAVSVQDMTRKLAFFAGEGFLITIHRSPLDFVTALKERWKKGVDSAASPLAHVINDLLRGVVESYQAPLDNCEERLEAIEGAAFSMRHGAFAPRDSYFLLRRASVIERMLRANVDVITKCPRLADASKPYFQDLKEQGDRLVLMAHDVGESVQNVISLSVSIADQRTNEVMRVLTVFSAFFLPLNFLAGLYGMNFEAMPLLKSPLGFQGMASIMIATSVLIFWWFKRKKWL